ncbi:MAG: carboxypeptidase-like regulatory domain-containing protein, partial [Planctomycetota bacterium]
MKSWRALLILLGAVAVFGIAFLLAGRREAAPFGEAGTAPSESEPAPAPEPREPERPEQGPASGSTAERRSVEGKEERAVVLRGRVVERDTRRPVSGARVVRSDDLGAPAWAIGVFEGLIDGISEAAQDEGVPKKRPGPLATTGEDGTFEILESAGLDSETKLAIEAPWHFLPSPVSAKPGQGGEVILEADRGGRLTGKVLDEEGRPASAARVSIHSSITLLSALGEAERPPVRRRVSTEEDGSFDVGGLPPGSAYKASAAGEGLTPVEREGIRIAEGEE